MSNIRLKVLSLAVALMMAFIVNNYLVGNDHPSVLQLIVPVEVQNIPPDKMIIFPLVYQAEVTLQGPSIWLSGIAKSPPIFRLWLPVNAQNRYSFVLKREHLILPPNVDVLSIKPAEIEFTFDKRVRKSVPVNVPRIGTLRDGLKMEGIKLKPDKIELSGPETELKSIQSVETSPIDLRDITESISKELEIRVPGTLSNVDQKRVIAEVSVASLFDEVEFENLSVEVRSAPGSNLLVDPPNVKIKVSGTKEVVGSLKVESLIPYVRVTKNSKEGALHKVQVELPKGISLVSLEPDKVTVIANPLPQATIKASGKESKKKDTK